MSSSHKSPVSLFLILGFLLLSLEAFAPVATNNVAQSRSFTQFDTTKLEAFVPSSSMDISAATLDPTTVLTDLLAGLLTTPAILAVPIVAALGVASVIAFLIVSYANPQVEDDE